MAPKGAFLMYSVLQREDYNFKVVSKNSADYAVLTISGFTEVYFGTQRKCQQYVENVSEN